MTPRYHCNDEMDFIGKNDQGYCFECKLCGEREYSNDPFAPTTPEEVPRYSMMDWNHGSKMGKYMFSKTSN